MRSLAAVRNVRLMHVLERIALRFAEAGVPLMALKGAALNLKLYGDPASRPMTDLDLMIAPEHAAAACLLLERLDGLRGEPLVREDFFPRYYYQVEYRLGRIAPIKVDLHVRPFRPLRYARTVPPTAFWENAESVQIGRGRVLIPSPEEMLIHLATHSAIHGHVRAIWLRDMVHWLDGVRRGVISTFSWEKFVETTIKWKLAWPVLGALRRAAAAPACGSESAAPWCPRAVVDALSGVRAGWRERLALWQAPRDANHPVAHVLTNAICTNDPSFVAGYVRHVFFPDAGHMGDWYPRRHAGWLLSAHLCRFMSPVLRRIGPVWRWIRGVETGPSEVHGIGLFATRDVPAGATVAAYGGRPAEGEGVYTVTRGVEGGEPRLMELTGRHRFMNHSCRPNVRLSGSELVALRPIARGEELRIRYGRGTCDCNLREALPIRGRREKVA